MHEGGVPLAEFVYSYDGILMECRLHEDPEAGIKERIREDGLKVSREAGWKIAGEKALALLADHLQTDVSEYREEHGSFSKTVLFKGRPCWLCVMRYSTEEGPSHYFEIFVDADTGEVMLTIERDAE